MLQLKSFGPAFGQPDASPFVVKAMCLLTMAKAEWENNPGSDSRKAPHQKLPALQHGTQMISDSEAIRYFLEEQNSIDFDEPLDAQQRAHSRALIRMVEEHCYFAGLRDRWTNDNTWAYMKPLFFEQAPSLLRPIIASFVRKAVVGQAMAQGIGRFEYDTMVKRISYDLDAIEQTLGTQTFLFGEKPTAADASVGAVLSALAPNISETKLKQAVTSRPNLVRYLKNIEETIYPKSINPK